MTTTETGRHETTRIVGTWIGLVLVAIVTATAVCVVDWLVMWGQSSTCNEAPDPSRVRDGQLWLTGVLLVSAAPWALGAATARHRVPVGVVGSFAVLPGLLFFLHGLSSGAWVGSFCF